MKRRGERLRGGGPPGVSPGLDPGPSPCCPLQLSQEVTGEKKEMEPDSCANRTPPLSVLITYDHACSLAR